MVIDGRTIANHILEDLTIRVKSLEKKYGIQPHMAVVRVGDDPATTSYIDSKQKTAAKIGATVSVYNHPESISQEKLRDTLQFLQKNPSIHGIILQLPIPKHLDEKELLQEISPEKDVDGFVKDSKFIVPVASAILKILEFVRDKESPQDNLLSFLITKKIVVIGKGTTGGGPVIAILQKLGIQPIVIDSSTAKHEQLTMDADIIIPAVGKADIIRSDNIKKDVILIGIGMHRNDDQTFGGDYSEIDIAKKASWYTPNPGGVGPVNVAMLMQNLVIAAECPKLKSRLSAVITHNNTTYF